MNMITFGAQMSCSKNFNDNVLGSVESQEHGNDEKVDGRCVITFFLILII